MKFDHRFQKTDEGPSMRAYYADGVTMRVDAFQHMLRVALVRDGSRLLPTWSVCPEGEDCPLEGRDKRSTQGLTAVCPEFREDAGQVSFRLDDVQIGIELKNFRITAMRGGEVLYQDRSGLAYNFAGELGDGSVHMTRKAPGEQIFGLGDKCGDVDKSMRSFDLWTSDAMGFSAQSSDPLYKHIPFYICRTPAGSYGIFYDTYSTGRINLGQEHDNYYEPFNSARFEEKNMVFYLIFGTIRQILARFSALCGPIAPVPEWAYRYCGSTMEYTDAPDADRRLRGFVDACEQNGIRAGGFYLSSGYTQIGEQRCVFHWNSDKIPSPEGLTAYFRSHGLELLPNVKPAFLTTHPMYQTLAEQGLFLYDAEKKPACFPFWGGMASYLDFTNPRAFAFWKRCVREQLIEKGCCNIWNDNNEYDVWDRDVTACMFGSEAPARLVRPLFSYLMARASREACLEAGVRKPMNVSRCAIAGTGRVATTWTGDNRTSFPDLRYNHKQAMTLSLSGVYWFGQDVGGFAGPKPSQELFLRWLQYALFTPRFVLHSWKPGEPSTMPWLYPEKMDAVRRLFELRERMIPYLAAQMERVRRTHLPLIYPVFLVQEDYDCESDCFFCGDDVLACPIFDEGAESVRVTLPETAQGWRLRGEGDPIPGGSAVTVPCLPDDLPVWFTRYNSKPW